MSKLALRTGKLDLIVTAKPSAHPAYAPRSLGDIRRATDSRPYEGTIVFAVILSAAKDPVVLALFSSCTFQHKA